MTVRAAAVSGMFYPSDPHELHTLLRHYLQSLPVPNEAVFPKAIIAPHAGYIYSGPIAASIYRYILHYRTSIRRVILLGPAHRVAFQGVAAPKVDFFETPLGTVPIDHEAIRSVKHRRLGYLNQAHEQEHSLEVQLPFLQEILESFTLIPLLVGRSSAEDISDILEALWGGDETLIVISSDLSHFESYSAAQRKDRATSQAIVSFSYRRLRGEDACGYRAIQGLLRLAKSKEMVGEIVDLRNSGDTAGDKSRVVGYGAYMFREKKCI